MSTSPAAKAILFSVTLPSPSTNFCGTCATNAVPSSTARTIPTSSFWNRALLPAPDRTRHWVRSMRRRIRATPQLSRMRTIREYRWRDAVDYREGSGRLRDRVTRERGGELMPCRCYFGGLQKQLNLFDAEDHEGKVPIAEVEDLRQYGEGLGKRASQWA